MKFENGRHLENYLLKILTNNNNILNDDEISHIRNLHKIYTFLSNIPNIESIIKWDGYYPWVIFAQNDNYNRLIQIAIEGNKSILLFESGEQSISFCDVFEKFQLGIEYKSSYIRSKPKSNDVYYPKHLHVVTYNTEFKKRIVRAYSKPIIPHDKNIGVYFIYGEYGELVYIGKSNVNLLNRACESARQRTNGKFSKIELRPMKTLADVNIYELYYIAMYHPIYNIDSCPDDFPTFSLPEVLPEYELHLLREETFDVEHIYPNIVQIQSKEYWKSPKDHYLALNFNRDKFIKSVSMILWKKFRNSKKMDILYLTVNKVMIIHMVVFYIKFKVTWCTEDYCIN
ncbi:hypothetical protein [Enterocloster bolteae]|jgi:hypothetical protein|uniref:hypothetical protein n=1 Tax=Enterocloster bolteae TaxID=208479 RepID=UPI00189753EA|nr:hypothetical protein [Enterocloster bolteae]